MTNIFKNYNCIAILGGTFNPIHNGHIMLCEEVLEQFPNIEQLIIMPNNMPAYKETEDIISSEHRINMLKLASKDIEKTTVSDMEIIRGGTTYTIDTLRQIKNINPDIHIYFIIGADSLYSIEKWREFDNIFNNCTLIAARRECALEDIQSYASELKNKYPNLDIEFLNTRSIDISSSHLRSNIKIGKLSDEFLDQSVVKYIKTNYLYGWKK